MILNVSNLYKTYTRRGEEFNAVDNVEFFAWSGDFSVIYGESGSGKSTLLSLLSGINRPSQGSIIFNGIDFANLTDAELSAIRNDKIGYIPQDAVFLPQFTVLENIFLPRAIRDGKKIEVRDISELTDIDILSKLETLGIAHLANEMPAELSGGELKRASIVRAMVNKPDIVIADEPTSNLDEVNGKKVFDLLAELVHSGTSVIVATHDTRGFKYGDRIYTMLKGKLLPSGESDYGGL
ncbi:MAG: ABC transporter ATP-binding protein [Fibrobacter sp.]|uniref:ABC transporter ATP-binding protein n=1 Tax=unclassified Fibrobacter TaxID=2634177 RepID=UPI00091B071D|nr:MULTISPECIES: ABC transporter ATP-binding protein [unclassified Fibrobacter]MDD5942247.1 ABC transporter ATP-binding protein [Fibrobacter sp.]MDY6263898.1 ABC transporter ATP-binding protein [Fibrobacter sp.]MDY6387598.1 ABC transporter ATP-binding protein [Fibrobacter sp.]SHK56846.1 putative ABC transport system ATP-binding protein [Fibrobacter sp. UWH4]